MTAREKKRTKFPSATIPPPPQMPQSVPCNTQPFKPLYAPVPPSSSSAGNPTPLPEGNRLQALSILGDILRKVGVSEIPFLLTLTPS